MKTKAISDVCSVNPRIPASLASQKDRDVDFVPMANLGDDGRISLNGSRKLGEVLKGYTYFENGDVLVAKITPCMENGKAAYVHNLTHGIAFGSTEFHVLRPNQEVEPRYLFHMIWSPYFRHEAARNMTGTAGQQRVPSNFFERFQIPMPSLSEQRRIADILDKADVIRRKRRTSQEVANSLALSLFNHAFGNNYRHPSQAKALAEVAEVVSGVTKGRRFNGAATRVVPYLRVANVQDGFLDLGEIKTIEALAIEVPKLALQHGDVVMTEGGDFDKLGRGALWEHNVPDCIHQNHVFRVRVNRDVLLPEYFNVFLRTTHAKAYFLSCAKKTSNLASINITQLKALPVPLPKVALQEIFVRELRKSQQFKTKITTHADEADDLFNSLVQRAFRGEL